MPLAIMTVRESPKAGYLLYLVMMSQLLVFSHGSMPAAEARKLTGPMSIGVIIDANSRAGKEQKAAIQIAVQVFNNSDRGLKLFLHFRDSASSPLGAASAANELIKEKGAQVIVVGMDTWDEAGLVADIGNKAQVPIFSLAAPAVSPPLLPPRWRFLVQMSGSGSVEMDCAAGIVHSYSWRRVIVVYEQGAYGGYAEQAAILSQTLGVVGVEIEYLLVLPPANSVSNPRGVVEELEKVQNKQSRVFIVLRSSVSQAAHLFREAKRMGLMEEDSVWIVTDAITSLMHSFNSSIMVSLNGSIGIKAYYGVHSRPFRVFRDQFQKLFGSEFLDEHKSEPGIHALRAYDSIEVIARALEKLSIDINRTTTTRTPGMLLQNMLSSNFTGLSGKIGFSKGGLAHSSYRIGNVVGTRYTELASCLPEEAGEGGSNKDKLLAGLVNWPGGIHRPSKGWAMPTPTKPLKIGVPGRAFFSELVKVEPGNISGFCIDVFNEVLRLVEKNYSLPYKFYPYNCTYDELIDMVYNQTLDAIVGDVTVLAERMERADFTQPFVESGLSMIIPVKSVPRRAWIFLKPFTSAMWVVTGLILVFTMFTVWFLEHQTNPHFRGTWNDQLSSTLWFTFSSLFFAHGERIQSNLTRVVLAVWLFVVLILTSSYTASLSSMLTIRRLDPDLTDIDWLKNNHQNVSCDGDSFMMNYLVKVLGFKEDNISIVKSIHGYIEKFNSHKIRAAFVEIPWAKLFLEKTCKGYTVINANYRFGGLSFVFQKGSPMTVDFSKAILTISENGRLGDLEKKWLRPTTACSAAKNATDTESLGLQDFWGLYTITGGTSTICFLLFLVSLIRNFRQQEEECEDNATQRDNSVWNKARRLGQYFHGAKTQTPTSPVAPRPGGSDISML